MQQALLEFNNVSHAFDKKAVLENVNLCIEPGMIIGLLGRNGAGKSTLLRSAVGLLTPQVGDISVFGQSSEEISIENKARIGYVPQQAVGYEGFTVQLALDMHASFYPNWDKDLEQSWLQRFELAPKAKVSQLSVGQRQALALIMAMAYRPQLLILDEPVASLDPIARRNFMQDLFELTLDSGSAVIFSTHITSDIERVASHLAILQQGSIFLFSELDELKSHTRMIIGDIPACDLSDMTVLHQTANKAIVSGYTGQAIAAAQQILPVSLETLFVEINE